MMKQLSDFGTKDSKTEVSNLVTSGPLVKIG